MSEEKSLEDRVAVRLRELAEAQYRLHKRVKKLEDGREVRVIAVVEKALEEREELIGKIEELVVDTLGVYVGHEDRGKG